MPEDTPIAGLTDRDLIKQAAEGSDAAFDELVVRFRDRLVRFAYRLIGDRETAEDVAQETLLRAYRALTRYDGRAEVSTWLFTIARNLSLNVRRDRFRHRAVPLPAVDEESTPDVPDRGGESPDAALDRSELSWLIEAAMAALPERQRTAVVLAKYEQMPYEEIARILDCSVGAVKLCVFRAKETLRQKLAPHLGD